VTWVFLAGFRLAVHRFDTPACHQRFDVFATHLDALCVQLVSQLVSTHEGMLQVPFVEPAHKVPIARGNWFRQVVHAAANDTQSLGLPTNRQFGFTVYHRFALSHPTLVSAPAKKSFSSVN
jgi:hypothetical protein